MAEETRPGEVRRAVRRCDEQWANGIHSPTDADSATDGIAAIVREHLVPVRQRDCVPCNRDLAHLHLGHQRAELLRLGPCAAHSML
jgi:hypothetical protein